MKKDIPQPEDVKQNFFKRYPLVAWLIAGIGIITTLIGFLSDGFGLIDRFRPPHTEPTTTSEVGEASTTTTTAYLVGYDTDWAEDFFKAEDFYPTIIEHVQSSFEKSIGRGFPMLRFEVLGFQGTLKASEGGRSDVTRSILYAIRIIRKDNGKEIQTLDIRASDPHYKVFLPMFYLGNDDYTSSYYDGVDDTFFSFSDFNNDGWLDLSFSGYVGGTSGASPSLIWLWDSNTKRYIYNSQLSDISANAYIFHREEYSGRDKWFADDLLVTYCRGGAGFYQYDYYTVSEYSNQSFELIEKRVGEWFGTDPDIVISVKTYVQEEYGPDMVLIDTTVFATFEEYESFEWTEKMR